MKIRYILVRYIRVLLYLILEKKIYNHFIQRRGQIKNFVYSVIATDQSPYLCRVFLKYLRFYQNRIYQHVVDPQICQKKGCLTVLFNLHETLFNMKQCLCLLLNQF